jgi:hypothetical protein
MRSLRQGDVLLLPVDSIPSSVMPVPTAQHRGRPCLVVARGERTGHAHTLPADPAITLFSGEEGTSIGFLEVRGDETCLRHEEHRPLPIAAGRYRVIMQRQHDPALARGLAVAD